MLGAFVGVLCALVLHAGVLLFGGLLFPQAQQDHGTLQQVELFSEEDAASEEEEPEQPAAETTDEAIEVETEEAPDAAEIVRNLELSAVAAAPALDAASLSAIEDALRGGGAGGMGFADAMSFSSGGRIGGTGQVGALEDTLNGAFSLAEIDQKPRAVFQAQPLYPSEMRGKQVEGLVTVIFVVDAAGKVTDPRVEKSNHPAFDKPALDAVRQWSFEAAVKSGQRVACKMRVPIRFQPS